MNELEFESKNVQTLFNELAEYAEAVEGVDITDRVDEEVTAEDVAEIKVSLCSVEYIDSEIWERVHTDLDNLVGRIITGRPPQRNTADTRGEIRIYEFGEDFLVRNDFYDGSYTMIVPEDFVRQELPEGWEAQPHGGLVESAHESGYKSVQLEDVSDDIVVEALMTFLKTTDVDVREVLDRTDIEVRNHDICAYML